MSYTAGGRGKRFYTVVPTSACPQRGHVGSLPQYRAANGKKPGLLGSAALWRSMAIGQVMLSTKALIAPTNSGRAALPTEKEPSRHLADMAAIGCHRPPRRDRLPGRIRHHSCRCAGHLLSARLTAASPCNAELILRLSDGSRGLLHPLRVYQVIFDQWRASTTDLKLFMD